MSQAESPTGRPLLRRDVPADGLSKGEVLYLSYAERRTATWASMVDNGVKARARANAGRASGRDSDSGSPPDGGLGGGSGRGGKRRDPARLAELARAVTDGHY